MDMAELDFIETEAQLEALYGSPGLTSLAKVADRITAHYAAIIAASPFVALATVGPEGLDCSPRGDPGHVLTVEDDRTILMPDRRGNKRIDSLRNIVRDPRVALLCLLPGSGMTLRINGTARVSSHTRLRERFAIDGKAPLSVVVITVAEVYFQCARAVLRSQLWEGDVRVDPATLPSAGDILEDMSRKRIDGGAYDREWPERAKTSLW